MILHIINASPFQHDALQRCREVATAQDAILFIEDGTLALSNPSTFLMNLPTTHVFVLEPDMQARGMTLPSSPIVTAVDFDGFVELTVQATKTLSWF